MKGARRCVRCALPCPTWKRPLSPGVAHRQRVPAACAVALVDPAVSCTSLHCRSRVEGCMRAETCRLPRGEWCINMMPGAVGVPTACFRARGNHGIQQLDPLRAAAPARGPPVARKLAAGATGQSSACDRAQAGAACAESPLQCCKVVPGQHGLCDDPVHREPPGVLIHMGPSVRPTCCQVAK